MPSPSGREPAREVVAAGAVVLGPHRQVLLVHRPKYDDWSFPKGKLDPGEHALTAAVREVREESGLRVRLGLPLADQRYPVVAGTKAVHYWIGRALDGGDVSRYRPNEEIDALRWVDARSAPDLLSYDRDRHTLEQARSLPRKTRTLVVLRHAATLGRRAYCGRDDRRRPLVLAGRRQAERLVSMLDAYAVQRIVSSPSTRCVDTVGPYARHARRRVERVAAFSEEEASAGQVARLTHALVADLLAAPSLRAVSLLCTHRPVLPWVWSALRLDDQHLEKGEMLVVHLGTDGPVACERHQS